MFSEDQISILALQLKIGSVYSTVAVLTSVIETPTGKPFRLFRKKEQLSSFSANPRLGKLFRAV